MAGAYNPFEDPMSFDTVVDVQMIKMPDDTFYVGYIGTTFGGDGIYLQRFDKDGSRIETPFRVDNGAQDALSALTMVALRDGTLSVTWTGRINSVPDQVYHNRNNYRNDGVETFSNDFTGDQGAFGFDEVFTLQTVELPNGWKVALNSYESNGTFTVAIETYSKTYNQLRSEVVYTGAQQAFSGDMDVLPDGNVFLSLNTINTSGSGSFVEFVRYNPFTDETLQSSSFTANTLNQLSGNAVKALSDGSVQLFFELAGSSGNKELRLFEYDANGNTTLNVNIDVTPLDAQTDVMDVVTYDDGAYRLVWSYQPATGGASVWKSQLFSVSGDRIGGVETHNPPQSLPNNEESFFDVSILPYGDYGFVIMQHDNTFFVNNAVGMNFFVEGSAYDDYQVLTAQDDYYGGGGDDYVVGNANDNILVGGGGIDILYGADGHDQLILESVGENSFATEFFGSRELAYGGDGRDTIINTIGQSSMDGGRGSDLLIGGSAEDTMLGDNGADILRGGQGNDMQNGGNGNDRVFGGIGDDVQDGGDKADLLVGGGGDDTMYGGVGNDVLRGKRADDQMFGGDGRDTITGGEGNDTMTGGEGNDLFVFNAADFGSDDTFFGQIDPDEPEFYDTVLDFTRGEDLFVMNGLNDVLSFSDLTIVQEETLAEISWTDGFIYAQVEGGNLSAADFSITAV
ncbi:MAG: calcium-binding protein [Pseudomonadota bacterium]